jgi:ribosomal protein L44E
MTDFNHIGYCPNCKKQTKQYGKEADRFGVRYKCTNCSHSLFDDGDRVIDDGSAFGHFPVFMPAKGR